MAIKTRIGEIGIQVGGKLYKLRPSFANLSKLGSGNDVIAMIADIFQPTISRVHYACKLGHALKVIYACCDEDMRHIFGSVSIVDKNGEMVPKYRAGLASIDAIFPLVHSLFFYGVSGGLMPDEDVEGDGEYKSELDFAELVYSAVAHLGCTEESAWDMTMAGYIMAMRAKFPQQNKASKKDTQEAIDRVMALREATK